MNEVKEAVSTVKSSDIYKEWIKENPGSYLACLILTLQSEKGWEVSFYSKSKNKMTTFSVDPVAVIDKDAEVFKKDETEVEELEIGRLFSTFDQVQEAVDKAIEELVKNDRVVKEILVLQKIKHNMWNIICITEKMTLVNIRIDAVTGKILKKEATTAFGLINKDRACPQKFF